MWFDRFMMGCHSRMGDIVKKDFAVSIEVRHELMRCLDWDWDRSTTREEKHSNAEIGKFCVVCFCSMLRGEEIVMMEMSGIVDSYDLSGRAATPHVIVPFLGRFKNEEGLVRHRKLLLVDVTRSGLEPQKWMGRLLETNLAKGMRCVFVFWNPDSTNAKASYFRKRFLDRLYNVQQGTDLISMDLDVYEEYGERRSLRREVDKHAQNLNIDPTCIELMARWRLK